MSMKLKRAVCFFGVIGSTILSTPLYASDFNLPFSNAAGFGNMYSGWASEGRDASTMAMNPAGLTHIHNKQFVGSIIGLAGSTQFTGTGNTIPSLSADETGSASSKLRAIIPGMFFVMPIKNAVVGIGMHIPFALGTNYPKDSIVRYAATRSQIVVTDLVPSIGFKLTEKLSAGVGLDLERLTFTLNHMFGYPISVPDSEQQNHLAGWGYGFHSGLLYDVTPTARIGISYASQVMFHTTGDSEVFSTTGEIRTKNQKANAALPALAQLSAQQTFYDRWTVMGTLFYTRWSTFQKLTLQNSMLPSGATTSVTIPFEYHDTFDYSLGMNFKANDQWLLRAGVQYLNTPSNNRDRSVPDPVGKATIIGLGTHYQYSKSIGFDVSYAHSFFQQTQIHYSAPIAFLTGHSTQNTNLLGAQIVWDMA